MLSSFQPLPTVRLAALTRYDMLGASSRVRTAQYKAALEQAGIALTLHPLLDDDYLRTKYTRGRTAWHRVLSDYAKRAATLPLTLATSDLVWLEKELWPWAPAWLERLLLSTKPWVLDIDDAIFHLYDQHPSRLVRAVWQHKIDILMRSAHLVTAGNDYLAARARQAGARWVEVLPTVIDLDKYPSPLQAGHDRRDGPPAIGWIGSPSTVSYLQRLAEPLAQLATTHNFELRIIGADLVLPGIRTVHVPWTEASEVAAIASCDIGVMPLGDTPWERGKCGYKLIQYMACGLPVVGSPVGVNSQIIEQALTGSLATTPSEWASALRQLLDDPVLRARMGAAGRRCVEARYSLQVSAPRLADWLRAVADAAGHSSRLVR